MAAAQAQQLQQQALTQGAEGLQSTLQAGLSEELLPLYGRKKSQQQTLQVPFTNPITYNIADFGENASITAGMGMPTDNQIILP